MLQPILGTVPQAAILVNGRMMLSCFISISVRVWWEGGVGWGGSSYKSRLLDLVPVVTLGVQSLSDCLEGLARPGASPSQLWPTCRVCSRKYITLSEPCRIV